jgi:hypothetical protein
MENYSKQRGNREGQVSLMSQTGECGAKKQDLMEDY